MQHTYMGSAIELRDPRRVAFTSSRESRPFLSVLWALTSPAHARPSSPVCRPHSIFLIPLTEERETQWLQGAKQERQIREGRLEMEEKE